MKTTLYEGETRALRANPRTSTVCYVDEDSFLVVYDTFEDFCFTTDVSVKSFEIDIDECVVFGRTSSDEDFVFDHVRLKLDARPVAAFKSAGTRMTWMGSCYEASAAGVTVDPGPFCLDVDLHGDDEGLTGRALAVTGAMVLDRGWAYCQCPESMSVQCRVFLEVEMDGPWTVLENGWVLRGRDVPANAWKTLVWNMTETTTTFYVDGNEVCSETRSRESPQGVLIVGPTRFRLEGLRLHGRCLTPSEITKTRFHGLLAVQMTRVDALHYDFTWRERPGATHGLDVYESEARRVFLSRRNVKGGTVRLSGFVLDTTYEVRVCYSLDSVHYVEDGRYSPLSFVHLPSIKLCQAVNAASFGPSLDDHLDHVQDGAKFHVSGRVARFVGLDPVVSVVDIEHLALPFPSRGSTSRTWIRHGDETVEVACLEDGSLVVDGVSYRKNQRLLLFGKRFRVFDTSRGTHRNT